MNLRKVASVSAGIAVISAIVAVNQWRGLRAERDQIDALRTQLAGTTAGQPGAPLPATGIDSGIAVPAQNTDASVATVAPQIPNADTSEQELLKDPEYRKAQSQAITYTTAFEQAGVPLDSFQIRTITKAIFDEQKSLKQDIVALARSVDLAIPESQAQAQYALKRRRGESNQHVFDAVNPWLTPQQMYVLRSQIEKRDHRALNGVN